jgi:hypothetical protein
MNGTSGKLLSIPTPLKTVRSQRQERFSSDRLDPGLRGAEFLPPLPLY